MLSNLAKHELLSAFEQVKNGGIPVRVLSRTLTKAANMINLTKGCSETVEETMKWLNAHLKCGYPDNQLIVAVGKQKTITYPLPLSEEGRTGLAQVLLQSKSMDVAISLQAFKPEKEIVRYEKNCPHFQQQCKGAIRYMTEEEALSEIELRLEERNDNELIIMYGDGDDAFSITVTRERT